MSYRCQLCTQLVPARQSRLVHMIYRDVQIPARDYYDPRQKRVEHATARLGKQIAREIPICDQCQSDMKNGDSTSIIKSYHKANDTAPEYKKGKPREKVVPVKIPDEVLQRMYPHKEEEPKKEKKQKLQIVKPVKYSELKKT